MKRFSKLIGFMVVFIAVIAAFFTVSFAATVGQQLTSPESGWSRYNGNNSAITYIGQHTVYNTTGMRIANGAPGSAKFSFYGTQFRIISFRNTQAVSYSANIQIKIDGVVAGSYSSIGSSPLDYLLAFEKTSLELGSHIVEITPLDSTTFGTLLYGIDIDNTGYLISMLPPSNLVSTLIDSKVNLAWGSTTGAAIYNVKRATTSGGIYSTIATTSAISYTDTSVTSGTYYYVVSAVNLSQIESANSNEASTNLGVSTPDAPLNLIASTGSGTVGLSWNSTTDGEVYIIKRSETSGGTYTQIATTAAITYADNTVTNGITYYYVVSAIVNGTESENSNEASATPAASVLIGNYNLELTMTNGNIKEYDLTATELESFLIWYDARSGGTAKAYYIINYKTVSNPFKSIKEYISFDKISSFKVKEY